MIKIRLARLGAKKNPIYRVVVADSRNARNNGRPVATLGMYDPSKDMDTRLTVDAEAAVAWLGKGAQADRYDPFYLQESWHHGPV